MSSPCRAAIARAAIAFGLASMLCLAMPLARARGGANARALFERGNRELAARRYVAALELFLRVAKVTQRRSVILNIGQTYRLLDLPHRALDYYKRYLASSRRARKLPYFADVKRFMARCSRVVTLVRRAEEQQTIGDCNGALHALSRAAKESSWARIGLRRAQCLSAVGRRAEAQKVAVAALESYNSLVREWSATGARTDALPDHAAIAAAIRSLTSLVRATTPAHRRDEPTPKPPAPRPAMVVLLGVP
ncbi:MAG: hypothetical protein KC503_36525, partial [Myxococcales bacterium]|nr:hypothetical protein [Myxococcales bacterium]